MVVKKNFIRKIIREEIDKLPENMNDNFWKWFGNSKVVDKDKTPIIVYHGTNTHFNFFDVNKMRNGWLSKGFYFTEDKSEAKHYGNIIISAYLRIVNPFFIEGDKIGYSGDVEFSKSIKEQLIDKYPELKKINYKDVTYFLMNKGYDGIINSNNLINVFNANQIKSIDNDGSWDINDNDIYS